MAAESRMFSTEETMRLIVDKSKETDNFWVKVQRRAHPGAHPTIVATLSGANVQHFTSPELWVPVLCGGGKFLLQAFHESDANRQVGGAILFPVDGIDVRDVDYSIFDTSGDAKKADWRGPARLEYPKPSAPPAMQDMPMYGINQPPPAPRSGDSATINRQAWPRLAGGTPHREAYDEVGNPLGPRAGAIEAERRILEKEKLDAEREKHRAELDSIRRTHDSELKSLEARLEAKLVAAKPSGPDPAMTMLMEFMKQQAEDRRELARQAAEDRRAAADRQAKADERFAQVLEKMSERKEKDPLELLKTAAELVRPKNDDTALMKTVHNMVEMQGTMMESAMNFVEHTSHLALGGGGGDDDPKWMKGLERLVKGVGKMATAAQVSRPQPGLPAPAAIPQGGVPRPQQQQQQAPQQQQQAPQQPQQSAQTAMTVIDQLEVAIRNKLDVAQVANALIRFYQDETVQAALEEAGGDFELLVQKRLGNWSHEAPENAAYLKKLFAEVDRQVGAAGFGADEDEDEDKDDGDEGGDAAAEGDSNEGDEDED